MDGLNLALALGLLWLPSLAWLEWLIPRGIQGRSWIVHGYAILAGLIGVPLLLRAQYALGFEPSFALNAGLLTAVGIAGLFLARRFPQAAMPSHQDRTPIPGTLLRWILITCLALLALRLFALAGEVYLRPLQPWDALMHWGTKSKVWLANGELSPFIEGTDWLALGGSGYYTDNHPDYPRTIPLLQVWVGLAIGGWHESLVNTPWLLIWIALGLLCYGQLRFAGSPSWLAAAGTYMLLSIPVLNQQVALAGYADLLLGTVMLAACSAFYHWSNSAEPWQGLLALLCALACLLIKNEGFFWLLCFLPGLAVARLPRPVALTLIVVAGLSFLLTLVLLPGDLIIAGHSLDQLRLGFRASAPEAIFEALFRHASWHLAPLFIVLGLPIAAWLAGGLRNRLLPLALTLGAAIFLFLILFTMTNYSAGALRFTAVNRIAVHLLPALWFLLLAGIELARQQHSSSRKAPASRTGAYA